MDVGVVTQHDYNGKGDGVRKRLECNKGSRRYYIQSAYSTPNMQKMRQEQRSLTMMGDFFKKIIITKDAPAPYYNNNGILVMSIYDFLLNPDSLEV